MKFSTQKPIVIFAPNEKVWRALTDPALIKIYFFGTETTTDWKKGSPIYFRGEWEGKPYDDKGIIIDSKEGEFIQYTYWSSFSGTADIPENYATITYTLAARNDGTQLTIMQDGLSSKESAEHSESNWSQILDNLKKMVEQ